MIEYHTKASITLLNIKGCIPTGVSSVIKDPQLEYLSENVWDFNEKFGKDLTERIRIVNL